MNDKPAAREIVASALKEALARAADELGWPEQARTTSLLVERPASAAHGDYASSIAMKLAKPLGRAPLQIAEEMRARIAPADAIATIEVARPGFINVRLADAWLARQVDAIVEAGDAYGRSSRLAGQNIQVEYISANPTGPMTVANARGGPLGDVLANVLAFAGARVTREHYENDAGSQIEVLARSVALRFRELGGEEVTIPEDAYPAEYVIDIARAIRERHGDAYARLSLDEQTKLFAPLAIDVIIDWHRRGAEKFGIHFDVWFRESSLMASGYFDDTVKELRRVGALEDRDGAIWLRSREMGEDIDSVVIRSNGQPTYFGVDIAYHRQCLVERGFTRKIDIWGANTHGHLRRMRTAMAALGLVDRWDVVMYQFVRFVREGELVRMARRLGQFLLLEDVIDAVGVDAARWFLLQSSADRTLDFDFELAVQQSNENPVYYVQYAHARIASILRTAAERQLDDAGADVSLLTDAGELALVRECLRFPELVADVLDDKGVHVFTVYALELAKLFHSFYRDHRVVSDDIPRSKARLRLVRAVQVTLRQTLGLLGVSAPETM